MREANTVMINAVDRDTRQLNGKKYAPAFLMLGRFLFKGLKKMETGTNCERQDKF